MNPETKIKEAEDQKQKRQTIVTKGIVRTIQTQQYFSLTITHQAQDVVEWETLEEREKKINNLTLVAVKDFKFTHDTVLNQLKLGEMHAFRRDHVAEKQAKKNPELLGLEEID